MHPLFWIILILVLGLVVGYFFSLFWISVLTLGFVATLTLRIRTKSFNMYNSFGWLFGIISVVLMWVVASSTRIGSFPEFLLDLSEFLLYLKDIFLR